MQVIKNWLDCRRRGDYHFLLFSIKNDFIKEFVISLKEYIGSIVRNEHQSIIHSGSGNNIGISNFVDFIFQSLLEFTPGYIRTFFLCLARIFLPLSHIGTTPRGCGTKKLKYSCLLCGRRKESPGFFFAGMQRRGPGMKKWRFFEPKELAIKNFSFPFLRLSLLTSNWGSSHIYLTPHQR